jgi:hypothetical protein
MEGETTAEAEGTNRNHAARQTILVLGMTTWMHLVGMMIADEVLMKTAVEVVVALAGAGDDEYAMTRFMILSSRNE